MKVVVDRDGCIGCGVCAEVCPQVFRIADDGLSEVIAKPDGNEDAVREAAESCPVEVIHVD
ncbi:MAG: ferredoxin [Oscillospiraceae bacterium]|nr:ferredoxin [Oscillospiraceae bacterium]